MNPAPTSPRSPVRTAGRTVVVITGYAIVLMVAIAVALTADFGVRTSVARDSVEVAVVPVAVAPIVEAAFGAAAETAKLTGVIQFDGNPPALDPVVKKGDANTPNPEVCAVADVPNESLVVNKDNKGIANVFVYLAKVPEGVKAPKPGDAPIVFDQKGCQFLPHCLIAPVGSKVLVKNGDPVPHNTHTHPFRNDGFNQSIQANDRAGVALKYAKGEKLPLEVVCDVHRFMKGYHLVLDHPYSAVTDADGKFEIPNLPAGRHEFVVWQEKAGYLNRKYEVTVKAGETKEVKLSFGAAKFAGFDGPRSKTIAVNAAP
jgi:hypothetical protein